MNQKKPENPFSKMDELKFFLGAMPTGQLVLTVSETFLTPAVADTSISVPGYSCYRKDRALSLQTNHTGGGLLCFVPSGLKVIRRLDLKFEFMGLEVMVLEAKVKRKQSLLIVTIYRPPKTNVALTDLLLERLGELVLHWKRDITIAGDFNVDLSPVVTTWLSRNYYDL